VAIEVDIYEQIRHLYEHGGYSQRAIARMLGVSRNTVKKYCKGAWVPWERQGVSDRRCYVITEEIIQFIKDCISEDEVENIKKQAHTAKRIYDRLVEEILSLTTGFSHRDSSFPEKILFSSSCASPLDCGQPFPILRKLILNSCVEL